MRRRYSQGGIKKQNGRWVAQWRHNGRRKSKVVGLVNDMSKSQAKQELTKLIAEENAKREQREIRRFGEFVDDVFVPYGRRKWKKSTRVDKVNRMSVHFAPTLKDRELAGIRRDELQDLLDEKAKRLSFSVVDHLRWDLKQIFDMAIAEGHIQRNPALLLFTPKEAVRREQKVMNLQEVKRCIDVLDLRERVVVKLATIAGLRPGEIFALTWGRVFDSHVEIMQRVYRGDIDTPKTAQSVRKAALSAALATELRAWRAFAIDTRPGAWVFPSERMTPLSKDNCWRRHIHPQFEKIGLGWANFLVMRRTHATIMKQLGFGEKLVADQLGHSVDVDINVYTKTPLELRQGAVEQLESALVM